MHLVGKLLHVLLLQEFQATQIRQIKKVQDYKEYLQGKYIELAKYAEEQKQSLTYHYPDVSNILSR